MSTIRANSITNSAGTGAPDFPNGVSVGGSAVTAIASQAQAEAGTSSTTLMTPLRVDQAVAAQVGVAKAWQSVTRNVSTNYQNTTGYPLELNVTFIVSTANTGYIDVGPDTSSYVRRVSVTMMGTGALGNVSIIIPPDWYYKWERQSTTVTINTWSERSA